MKVHLIWITPDAEKLIVEMARVSNPESAAKGGNEARLINYLREHSHWSPFEMASACFGIETTRDIARQILRHRSFSFQEFSQRYAEADGFAEPRECRLQDTKNRQGSLPNDDQLLADFWYREQKQVIKRAEKAYSWAIKRGIAKEVARSVLPEGLTASRLYMAGTFRSWIHYLDLRTDEGTQKEHQEIAGEIGKILAEHAPSIF